MSQDDQDQQKDQQENVSSQPVEAVNKDAPPGEANSAKKTDGSSDSGETETTPKASREKAKKSSKTGLVLFVLVLILLAFGGGGYGAYYYLNQQALERELALNDGLQRVQDGFRELESRDQDLQRKQDDLQRALTAAVAGTENQMAALAERLAASESTGPADWTLAEVEYLLRIANQRLITSADHSTAIEMLQAADTILKELAYPELASVRRQLAADITRLQLARRVDVEGVYFILQAMASEIARLDQFAPEQLEPVMLESAEEGSKLMALWNGIVEVLSKYVRIDTEAGDPEYLVSDEQEVIQRQAIQLQLRQAQLALLSGQQQIYSEALSGAADSVRLYYDAENIAHKLDQLSARRVEQQSMDVNDSVRALSEVVDQLSRTAREPSAVTGN